MSLGVNVELRDLMAGIGGDQTLRDLFGMSEDRIRALRQKRDIDGARRQTLAAAIARVLATADGRVLFDCLLDLTFRGHVDVVGLGLSSDVALQQLIAENARKELVVQLIKLAREGAGEPAGFNGEEERT